jgi:hypothetical protein
MRKSEIIDNLNNMDEIMERTAKRADIWQDRCVYWLAKAVRDILIYILKEKI